MAKYKVGDRVRIVSKRTGYMSPSGDMDKYLGTVMTIAETHDRNSYKMEEDSNDNGKHGWYWYDEMIEGLADEATPHPESRIKDSGQRTQFGTGAVRDLSSGKGRMDLLPWTAVMEVSKHCENGAIKYGEHNVDKGIPIHSLVDSASRHLAKYIEGWDDEPHLVASAWNLLWAIQMELLKPEMQDLPKRLADNITNNNPQEG